MLPFSFFSYPVINYCESPLLFVGFGFDDSDFHDLWQSVKDYAGATLRLQPLFLAKPNPAHSFVRSMEVEGIIVIDSDVTNFFPWLKANLIKQPLSIDDKVIERGAPITIWAREKFAISLPPVLADNIKKSCDIISELPLPVRMSEKSRFLLGVKPYWDDIQNNIPIKKEIEGDLIEDINIWINSKKKPSINLLLGAAGYGKTTVMMQAAYDISKITELVVLWVKQTSIFDPTPISEFCQSIKSPVIIFIDDASKHMFSIKRLYLDAVENKLSLYIFAASRPSEWNSARGVGSISIQSLWNLPRLTEKEGN